MFFLSFRPFFTITYKPNARKGKDDIKCLNFKLCAQGRKYELVATVTHHGKEASKGHYTADVRYPNGQWLRFDDASLTSITTAKVLHDRAYLLFYKQL